MAFFPELEMNGNAKRQERIDKDKAFNDNGKIGFFENNDKNRKEKHREQSN